MLTLVACLLCRSRLHSSFPHSNSLAFPACCSCPLPPNLEPQAMSYTPPASYCLLPFYIVLDDKIEVRFKQVPVFSSFVIFSPVQKPGWKAKRPNISKALFYLSQLGIRKLTQPYFRVKPKRIDYSISKTDIQALYILQRINYLSGPIKVPACKTDYWPELA